MGEATITVPSIVIHARAQDCHSDGSRINTCDRCINFDLAHKEAMPQYLAGFCSKTDKLHMWFGNCDFWWPKSGDAGGISTIQTEDASSIVSPSRKRAVRKV